MKDWTTLKKDDVLHLLVPKEFSTDDLKYIKYEYQESKVINVHYYENLINVRFKYTGNDGKRHRVELSINKSKYNESCLASDKKTSWVAHYNPKYGDILVSYVSKEELNKVYSESIQNEIKKYESLIESQRKIVNQLRSLQYLCI